MSREIRALIYDRSLFIVDHDDEENTLVSQDLRKIANGNGLPVANSFPNSIAFEMQNVGSTFIRIQFDNVRYEVTAVPEASAVILLILIVLGTSAMKRPWLKTETH